MGRSKLPVARNAPIKTIANGSNTVYEATFKDDNVLVKFDILHHDGIGSLAVPSSGQRVFSPLTPLSCPDTL
jgi:hypothetical protein